MTPFALAQREVGGPSFCHVPPDRRDETALVGLPARQRYFEIGGSAALATAGDLERAFTLFDAAFIVGDGCHKAARILQEQVNLLAQQFLRREAENPFGSAVDPLDPAIHVGGDDGVRRRVDDGAITRVLTLAQNALARHRNGDVIDLQQAEIRQVR